MNELYKCVKTSILFKEKSRSLLFFEKFCHLKKLDYVSPKLLTTNT